MELERTASKICEFEPTVVPGLLQTAEYTRAITQATHPFGPDEFIEEKVAARMDRAHVLEDATRPEYWVIMHEAVLRIPVGGSEVMVQQLDRLTTVMRKRQAVVQILPFAAGALAYNGSLRLMEFEDAPPTAYTETSFSGSLLDDPLVVKRAGRAYDLLRAAALSPEASLALIRSAAEDYRRCTSTS